MVGDVSLAMASFIRKVKPPPMTSEDAARSTKDARMLATISNQFGRMADRVVDDVEATGRTTAANGFLLYYLTDPTGEPLKSLQTRACGITLNDIQSTPGYGTLRDLCESNDARLRIDEHFYSDDPEPTTIYRVIVDGWA